MNSNKGYNNNSKKSDNIETSNCFQPLSSRLGKYIKRACVSALAAPIIASFYFSFLYSVNKLLATQGNLDVEPPLDAGQIPTPCAVSLWVVGGHFASINILARP
jgi:hypothetical protein